MSSAAIRCRIGSDWLRDLPVAKDKMGLAVLAALATVLIAAIGSLASYVANYYTESVGQWVAHDLRMRTYHHLQRLSLSYYDSHQVGTLLSTITADISTIQSFASSATLGILVDLMTIVGMLVLMFYLNWDFALIAVAVTPFLLLFVSHFNKAVKSATQGSPKAPERHRDHARAGPGIGSRGESVRPRGTRGEPTFDR